MQAPRLFACLAVLLLLSCSDPEPIKVGFIGGLSGRVADLGLAGRNGAMLAVEERNQAGGINGRKVELLLADDKQSPKIARQQVQQLIEQGVVAIIGPMTSAMATATVDLVNDQKITMLSPTVTTESLTGLDDFFLRICSDSAQYSATMARFLRHKRGVKKIAVVYDLGNQTFTASWLSGFKKEFEALAGEVVLVKSYRSGPEVRFSELATEITSSAIDAVLSISAAMDTAMFSQQLRKLGFTKPIAATAWSATEKLIEMGGKAVEGMIVAQFFDRQNQRPAYLKFRDNYRQRFIEEPGFVSVAAYDATRVILEALIKAPGQRPKQTILEIGKFQGIQQPFHIDQYGDASRPTYITLVKEGQFIVLE